MFKCKLSLVLIPTSMVNVIVILNTQLWLYKSNLGCTFYYIVFFFTKYIYTYFYLTSINFNCVRMLINAIIIVFFLFFSFYQNYLKHLFWTLLSFWHFELWPIFVTEIPHCIHRIHITLLHLHTTGPHIWTNLTLWM